MRPEPRVRRGVLVLLCLALVATQSWATYQLFTSRFPGGNDFYARWANGCALVRSGQNPYSTKVMLATQIGMHGRPARLGEDLAAYSYPLYALFFFWPLCFIQVYPLVQAIWMTLMLYALLAGIVFTARTVRWRPPVWLWGFTLLWGIVNYPHARALVLGQMATLVFLALSLTLYMLSRERDWLAGASLAVTTIKPQMSFLLIPWILWWAAWRQRWGVWKGFAGVMGLLIGTSFLLVPTWLSDFITGIRQYDVVSGTDYHSLTWIIVEHFLRLGPVVKGLGVAACSLTVAWVIWRRRETDWDGFLWVTGLILVLTNFIAPRTATTHYSMLLLPLFALFARLKQVMNRWASLTTVALEAGLLVGQWVIFLTTLQGNYETAAIYLPLPLLMLAVQGCLSPNTLSSGS